VEHSKFNATIPTLEAACEMAAGDPGDLRAEIAYWLGKAYLRSGNTDKALTVFKQLMSEYPTSRWAHFAHATIEEKGGTK
jgi:outer membrane protein assembly factor BamD (BamD/ComL family)